jgi:GT2 family glycosyltransferase
MGLPSVHIILVNWNGYRDTIECVHSLQKISYPNYQIVVVDNGSTNESVVEIKKTFPGIPLLEENENLGFAHGNNVGLAYAKKNGSEYVLFLNNDTIVDPDFLTRMVETAETDPKVGAVGAKIYFAGEPNRIWWSGGKVDLMYGWITNQGYGEIDQGQWDTVRELDYICGCCFLARTTTLNEIGGWDETYFHTFEDTDLSIGIHNAGYKLLIQPAAKIWHKISQSGGGELTPFFLYYLERNRFQFVKKHGSWHPFTSWVRLLPIMVKRLAGVSLKTRNWRAVFAVLRGWVDFSRGIQGGSLQKDTR